jgi:hypothetical protein
MEAEKLGGYTVKEWRQMIEDKVVVDVSEDVLEFIKPNMFERRNAENKEARKESVTEELYYVRNKAFWATLYCGGQKAVTAIPAI